MYGYEALALTASFLLLAYASIEDLRKREIPDKVWLVFLLCGLVVRAMDVMAYPTLSHVVDLLVASTIPILISLTLYYVGFFGGADAKALMCIALTTPNPPSSLPILYGFVLPLYALSVFDNAVLLSLSTILINLASNAQVLLTGGPLFEGLETETIKKKAVAFFTCRRVRTSTVRSRPDFYAPAEEVIRGDDGTSHRRIKLMYRLDDGGGDEGTLPDSEYMLAHYTIPLVVFIVIGLAIALLVGDLILLLVQAIFSPFT